MKTLYKKTSMGKIQMWRVWVDGCTIHSESGQTDGKKTLSMDIIKEGKNIGRSNATTAEQQAVLEAESKYTKKLKSGYVDAIQKAQDGVTDDVISGGYVPTTALVFEKAEKHFKYAGVVQPKLDGMRCCTTKDGIFSRTRKPINSVPHIVEAINELADKMGFKAQWDGELYNHKYKDNFEEIISMVKRKKDLHPNHKEVEYHIYDINISGDFLERRKFIKEAKKLCGEDSPLKFVETRMVMNRVELMKVYRLFVRNGYEGAMARNIDMPYEHKRSKGLMKMKMFQDAEFKVIGIEEGKGKLMGHAATFVCEIDDKYGYRTFSAKIAGKQSFLKDCFNDESLWMGKQLTVKFFRYTNKEKVPYIGTGVRFREEE